MGNQFSAPPLSHFERAGSEETLGALRKRILLRVREALGNQYAPNAITFVNDVLGDLLHFIDQPSFSQHHSLFKTIHQHREPIRDYILTACKDLLFLCTWYALPTPSDPSSQQLDQIVRQHSLDNFIRLLLNIIAIRKKVRESERLESSREDQLMLQNAEKLLHANEGVKFKSWSFTQAMQRMPGTDVDIENHEAMWNQFYQIAGFIAVPYGDPVALHIY